MLNCFGKLKGGKESKTKSTLSLSLSDDEPIEIRTHRSTVSTKSRSKKIPAVYTPTTDSENRSKSKRVTALSYKPSNGAKTSIRSVSNSGKAEMGARKEEDGVMGTGKMSVSSLRRTGNILIPYAPTKDIALSSSIRSVHENVSDENSEAIDRPPGLTITKINNNPSTHVKSPSNTSSSSGISSLTPPSLIPDDISADSKDEKEVIKVVGISGCSSSGKSTLAFLMTEIFNPGPAENGLKKFLAQDDFFRLKHTIPKITFVEKDCHFVRESAREKDCTYDFTAFEENGVRKWKVCGPDSDAATAVDFALLRKDVAALAGSGVVSEELEKERCDRGLGMVEEPEKVIAVSDSRARPPSLQSQCEAILEENFGGLISELQKSVAMALKGSKIKFAFVEGFLLFANPNKTPKPNALEWNRHILHAALDIPIFLPTSKTVAKERRFSRKAYLDAPEGERLPGQMWKGEGYFEEVVWKDYLDEFGWILDQLVDGKVSAKSEKVDGVWVRTGEDVGIEKTVRWAVRTVVAAALESLKAADEESA